MCGESFEAQNIGIDDENVDSAVNLKSSCIRLDPGLSYSSRQHVVVKTEKATISCTVRRMATVRKIT